MTGRIKVTPMGGGEAVEIYEEDLPRFTALGWKLETPKKPTTPTKGTK